jgi:G3E family GTPase
MQRKGAFDYILLETTGLADPGKYLDTLLIGAQDELRFVSFFMQVLSLQSFGKMRNLLWDLDVILLWMA